MSRDKAFLLATLGPKDTTRLFNPSGEATAFPSHLEHKVSLGTSQIESKCTGAFLVVEVSDVAAAVLLQCVRQRQVQYAMGGKSAVISFYPMHNSRQPVQARLQTPNMVGSLLQVFGGDKGKTRRVANLQSDVAALEAAIDSARAEYDKVLDRNMKVRTGF